MPPFRPDLPCHLTADEALAGLRVRTTSRYREDDYFAEHREGVVLVSAEAGETIIGRFDTSEIDLVAADAAGVMFEAFDHYCADLAGFYSPLDESGLMDVWESAVLVRQIELAPAWRGLGLGLHAMSILIDRFADLERGGVAVEPGPIGEASPGAVEKLRAHWSKLGFWQVDDSSVFALDTPWDFGVPKTQLTMERRRASRAVRSSAAARVAA